MQAGWSILEEGRRDVPGAGEGTVGYLRLGIVENMEVNDLPSISPVLPCHSSLLTASH